MRFSFSTEDNEGKWLWKFQQEWLETNGLGGYASSSLAGCNTRKYHGLFVVNLPRQADRHVLLSTLEEHLNCGETRLPLSSRQHPDVLYPKGHEYIDTVTTFPCLKATYRYGDIAITRSLLFLHKTNTLLIRYHCENAPPTATLSITPLLAFRSVHQLTHENNIADATISLVPGGMAIRLYPSLPTLYIQSCPSCVTATISRDWCRNVYYTVENERGFPAHEDLYMPGQYTLSPSANGDFYLTVGLEAFPVGHQGYTETFETLWTTEINRRLEKPVFSTTALTDCLTRAAETFTVRQPHVGTSILAGYHWFNAWGRDTFIALPGLCFCTGRHSLGQKILMETRAHARGGLVPNILSPDGDHAYNSVDASLWYLWAVQQMTFHVPESLPFIKKNLWPFLKEIVLAYLAQPQPAPSDRPALSRRSSQTNQTNQANWANWAGQENQTNQINQANQVNWTSQINRENRASLEFHPAPCNEPGKYPQPGYGQQGASGTSLGTSLDGKGNRATNNLRASASTEKEKNSGTSHFSSGHHTPMSIPHTSVDREGFLQVGTPETQLTWMDAMAYGKAVTPRNGYPVEMNALWYNGVRFVNELAEKFGEAPLFPPSVLEAMPQLFLEKFWVTTPTGGYLADVWSTNSPSRQIRPNQIFAVAMPFPLVRDKQKAQAIVQTVTEHLLTPYGLRTLSPGDRAYCPHYAGGPDERDAAYHQGTVWPWLLGAYTEALLKTSDDKTLSSHNLLETITPLLRDHIRQAGVGSISEIFDAEPPYRANGCISQTWSVAEILRLIAIIDHHCPGAFQMYAGKNCGDIL